MTIELSPEDEHLVASLVAQGRFSTASDVVSASLTLMQREAQWRNYAQQRIDSGVEAATQNDFAGEQDVDAMFARYQRKSA